MKAATELMTGGRLGAALNRIVAAVERQESLDGISTPIASLVQAATRAQPVKNVLSGTWLGHQLHPLMTDLPIGFWTSAIVLDLAGGKDSRKAADMLLALGNLSAVGAAASGLADWSEMYGAPQRAGLVHAATNAVSLTLFSLSSAARVAGNRGAARKLALAGGGVVSAGAYIGGHLVYSRGIGVSHAGFEIDDDLGEWQAAMAESDLSEGQPKKVTVNGEDVFLLKTGGQVAALANHCTHAGGPLDEGEVRDGTVVCPWHGSTFQVADGCVVRGPAAQPQPSLEVRVTDGQVEVRARVS